MPKVFTHSVIYRYLGYFWVFFCYYIMNIHIFLGAHVDRFLWGAIGGTQQHHTQSNFTNYTPSSSVFRFPLFYNLFYIYYFQIFSFC